MAKRLGARWDPDARLWWCEVTNEALLAEFPVVRSRAIATSAVPSVQQRHKKQVYVNVPENDTNYAKQLGARWDSTERLWWCEEQKASLIAKFPVLRPRAITTLYVKN